MKDGGLWQKVEPCELHAFESEVAVEAALDEVSFSAYFFDDVGHLLAFKELCNFWLI